MFRKDPHERQDRRDVERAVRLIAEQQGVTGVQGARLLDARAGTAGISVHAAALATLSSTPRSADPFD